MIFPDVMLSLKLLPCVGWRGELEAQKVKIAGWDKNNLLESARNKKIKGNSNNTNDKGYKEEVIDSQGTAIPNCSLSTPPAPPQSEVV